MSVREDGWFALVSRSASSDDPKAVVVHIDVYNETGRFQKSLSYLTPAGGDDVELTDRAIQVYFYSEMLSFDLETDMLTAYAIPDNAVMDSGLHSELMKSTVEKNGCVYTAKKEFLGAYTKLVRSNGAEAQTLIELTGTGSGQLQIFLSFAQAAVLLFLIPWIVRYARNRKKRCAPQNHDFAQYTIEVLPDDPDSTNGSI